MEPGFKAWLVSFQDEELNYLKRRKLRKRTRISKAGREWGRGGERLRATEHCQNIEKRVKQETSIRISESLSVH